ncbi:uncharacterized protein BYT42DRAFT_575275 [Radiomyces spectabilis]|uniref:uncharacterized protein n=1 Tax=Radiomyces spectabilis TaxID=64574 RepID=UPI00221EDF65|nr:uncharacterized protein BYT42DRAFT_575275 [Radiomyces spectabilis]KAI8374142.1 hypothetical protein BYT42DRAFT_575275 [Radiomyces spectabilis]
MLLWTLITASLFGLTLANPCADLSEQGALDECYMRSALDLALERNPRAPFGTVIVDHTTNKISCYGVNSNYHNILMHGKITI